MSRDYKHSQSCDSQIAVSMGLAFAVCVIVYVWIISEINREHAQEISQ